MSFEFSVRGADRDGAMARVRAEMDAVVRNQPVHAKDEDLVLQTCEAYLELAEDPPEGSEFQVWASGSLTWRGSVLEADPIVTGASVSVSVGHATVPPK